jgi:hypothetical protein
MLIADQRHWRKWHGSSDPDARFSASRNSASSRRSRLLELVRAALAQGRWSGR